LSGPKASVYEIPPSCVGFHFYLCCRDNFLYLYILLLNAHVSSTNQELAYKNSKTALEMVALLIETVLEGMN